MDITQKIIQWAKEESSIRALILQGSRAANRSIDEFSDYDISVFCSTSQPYTETENWLAGIGVVWVCVKEKISCKGQMFPTRLVIFENGIKVDFSFFPLDSLHQMSNEPLPNEYNRGYQILLDKDNLTQKLPKPNYQEPKAQKPSSLQFLETIEEFWFEAYHVAVYLKREDLWSVKLRSASMHIFLLKIIEWEAQARHGWRQMPPPIEKRMVSWIQPGLWQELHGIFAHFDASDSWDALFHTLSLFRRLSIELSHQFGFDYPTALDQNMSHFIMTLRKGPHAAT